ncbi:MAG: hypothetical protein D3923_06945 [Candidatus Electrothrix sp. AR3]|nr:hypothetical protein [Candidatus Electrothrix sp. AR3]
MSDLGRKISGSVRVKTAFAHQGRNYAVGDIVEGRLINHQGVIVFERIDFARFAPANFDRRYGVSCRLTFAYNHSFLYRESGIIKKKDYVQGESAEGIIKEKKGKILFFLKGEHPITINKFMDDVTDLEYENGVSDELKKITRLLNALG